MRVLYNERMKTFTLKARLGLLLLILSLLWLGVVFWPLTQQTQVLSFGNLIVSAIGPIPTPVRPEEATPVPENIPTEQRSLQLEWPEKIRVGEARRIRLGLEMLDAIKPAGDLSESEVITPSDWYAHYNVVVESRLDLAGMSVKPDGTMNEPMRPGEPVVFYWSVSPEQTGSFEGTVWVYINLIPKNGQTAERFLLLARPLDIQAVSFLGMPAWFSRGLGAAGAFLGLIFGFPFFESILKWIWGKIRKQAKSPFPPS